MKKEPGGKGPNAKGDSGAVPEKQGCSVDRKVMRKYCHNGAGCAPDSTKSDERLKDQDLKVLPENIEVSPEDMEVSPVGMEVSPVGMEVSPEDMEVSPEGMEVSPVGMEVSLENMEVSPEDMEVSPEGMEVSPEDMKVSPEDMKFSPEDMGVSPEDMKVLTDDMEVPPEGMGVAEDLEDNKDDDEEPADIDVDVNASDLVDYRPDCLRSEAPVDSGDLPDDPTSWPYSLDVYQGILESFDTMSDEQNGLIRPLPLYQLEGDITITTQDLYDLAQGSCVGDRVVAAVLSLINSTTGHDCYALHPELMYRIRRGLSVKNYSQSTKVLWEGSRYLFMPADKPQHWVLNVADRTNHIVYHQDNLHGEYPELMVPLLSWLEEVEGDEESWAAAVNEPPAQLADSNDCAMGVIAGMLHFIKHGSLVQPNDFTGEGLSRMRGRVFAMILFATLDPPSDIKLVMRGLKVFFRKAPQDEQVIVPRPARMSRIFPGPSEDKEAGELRRAGEVNEKMSNFYINVKSMINSKFLKRPVQLSIKPSENPKEEFLTLEHPVLNAGELYDRRMSWDFDWNFRVTKKSHFALLYIS